MKRVTFWQTNGGSVEVPDDKVEAFEEAVANNTTDMPEWAEVIATFDPSHYEGQIVEVEES